MTIEEITFNMNVLKDSLRNALSTMEHSDKVLYIRKQIKELQNKCPHESDVFHLDSDHRVCPYCGYKRGE